MVSGSNSNYRNRAGLSQLGSFPTDPDFRILSLDVVAVYKQFGWKGNAKCGWGAGVFGLW